MKYYQNLLLLLLLALSIQSCVKDHSTSEISDINEVRISNLADTITVSVGELLTLTPKLDATNITDASHEYVWYAYTEDTQDAADTLSKERNLSAEIHLRPGTHTLIYRITDKNTGIFYKHVATVVVVNDYTPGIMILGETGGQADVHFLNTANGKFFENIYQGTYGGLGKNPVSVSYYPRANAMPAEVLILCADDRGGIFADPITFEPTRELKNSFFVPITGTPEVNVSKYVAKEGNLQDYLIIDGQAYNRAVNSGDLLFKPAMLGDYYLSAVVFNEQADRATFYDERNKRFLAHNNTSGSLSTFLTVNNGQIINPNNVGLNLLYAGATNPEEFFGLFQTPDMQEYYILRMHIDAFGLSFTAIEKYQMSGEHIAEATAFASSPMLSNYLLYAVGSKCYVYNVASRSGGLLFDMGSDYDIDLLKMNGTELKVAFRNHSLGDRSAGFATYNISTQGGINASPTRVREGLFDRIVDITDKQ